MLNYMHLLKKKLMKLKYSLYILIKAFKISILLNVYLELIKYVISDYIPLTFLGTDFLSSP